MRWMPVGGCFWLRCSLFECSIETAVKVGHYTPDLVVSVYNELGGNPWSEIRATLGLAQRTAATGLLGTLLPVPIDSAGGASALFMLPFWLAGGTVAKQTLLDPTKATDEAAEWANP